MASHADGWNGQSVDRSTVVLLAAPIVVEGFRSIGCSVVAATGYATQLPILCARHRPDTVVIHSDGRGLDVLLPCLQQLRRQSPELRLLLLLPESLCSDLHPLFDTLRVEAMPSGTDAATLATLLGVGQMAPTLLTGREIEVLQLAGTGLTNAAIGRRLALSENTVKNYLRSVHRKLGARSRTEAVMLAAQAGYRVLRAG